MSIKVTLPDASQREVESGATALNVAEGIGAGLARASVAARIDGELHDITTPLTKDCELALITTRDDEGQMILRHTAAHVLALAVKRLWPEAILEDGPATENGFFYDILLPETITPDDLPRIEAEMKNIVKNDLPHTRKDVSREEAIDIFEKRGEAFKVETIKDLHPDIAISVYEMGELVDLCRGPHLPSSGGVKAVQLTTIAGAYRKGDAEREQLTRIYGLAFPDKKQLKQHLHLLEEAKKRDHRRIGQDLDLWSFQEEGPGFPFFHPRGTIIYNTLLSFMREELDKRNYDEIRTPIILNEELWHRSGHWDNYRENMYFTQIDERDFAVKPMNCPGGLLVYRNGMHSYRDLPMRVAEFGLVHRHEMSGVLHGLFRVRSFTQDDAHVFCTPEQLRDEIKDVVNLILHVYNTVGFEDIHIELSTRPEKSIGTEEVWELATSTLKDALTDLGIDYQLNPGDGAFYGPKIDFHIKDCLNRSWQCGTIQADFSMPERFDLNYVGSDGERHRPVMIHRAIFGSIERFLGILVEHYAGNFPLWLAPVQVRALAVSGDQQEYADQVVARLREAGLRADTDPRAEKIGAKIRQAELEKIPAMLIVGQKEAADGSVSVRRHGKGDTGMQALEECVAALVKESVERMLDPAE